MSFTLKLHGVIVGRSELEDRDPTTRTAAGIFRPGTGYELVEPIFALPASARDAVRYRAARDTLALALFDAHDTLIDTSTIDIHTDPSEPGRLRISVRVHEDNFWR